MQLFLVVGDSPPTTSPISEEEAKPQQYGGKVTDDGSSTFSRRVCRGIDQSVVV